MARSNVGNENHSPVFFNRSGCSGAPVPGATNLVTLDYAPDGKGFFSGDSSSTEARQLYIDLSGKTTLLWRQAGRSVIWGIPSPDGRHLAMLMYTNDSNVYMVEDF